jgi:hypothetical protein
MNMPRPFRMLHHTVL